MSLQFYIVSLFRQRLIFLSRIYFFREIIKNIYVKLSTFWYLMLLMLYKHLIIRKHIKFWYGGTGSKWIIIYFKDVCCRELISYRFAVNLTRCYTGWKCMHRENTTVTVNMKSCYLKWVFPLKNLQYENAVKLRVTFRFNIFYDCSKILYCHRQ